LLVTVWPCNNSLGPMKVAAAKLAEPARKRRRLKVGVGVGFSAEFMVGFEARPESVPLRFLVRMF
jgi:hypothetical protein